ncbi:MAG TPA: transposase [Ktedonobacterales bacterium]|nr:transposase [Ktedonobacterales bacterium]
MLILPAHIIALLNLFAPLFSRRTWRHVPLLVVGAILAPGQRMVSSALRAVGLSHERHFQTYHRVLNRASWSSLGVSRTLLGLLVATFAPTGPLIVGIDETIERRRGPKIAAAGIYRDPVRSSHSHFVKVNGLRWICLHLLIPIPWAAHTWALPFLTALAPSERYARRRRRRFKSLTLWARQLIRLVHRWQPDRRLVIVGDRAYAALELLAGVRAAATVVARLRLDAHLCAPPPRRLPGQTGRPRIVGARLPNLSAYASDPATPWTNETLACWYGERDRPIQLLSATAVWYHSGLPPVPIRWVLMRDPLGQFATQAVLCTDLAADPLQIVSWFTLRWQMEVTFREVRAHLGVETQRQWSDRAIARATPALLGLFSLVTLLAHDLLRSGATLPCRQSAWYRKPLPTFADALALVRGHLWRHTTFPTSPADADLVKVPRALVEHLHDLLCYAA